MPPIHGSVATRSQICRVAVLSLLIVLSGCGRSRSDSESARSVEPQAERVDIGQASDDRSEDFAGSESRPQPTAVASQPPPPNAASPSIATSPGLEVSAIAAPVLERAQAERIARAEGAGAESSRADVARAPARRARASRARTPIRNSVAKSVAIKPDSPEIAELSPAFEMPDSVATALSPGAAALSIESEIAIESPSDLPAETIAEVTEVTAVSEGFVTVPVYYATDRQPDRIPLSAYEVTGNHRTLAIFAGCFLLSMIVSAFCGLRGRTRVAAASSLVACVTGSLAVACVLFGSANIEKRGVTYSGGRGQLTRGICEVTIPKVHHSGIVERPSLLRFEFREDQQKHIVLTSAVELSEDDFHARLSDSVAGASEQDLLVFIHGYNVDFQSAVRRTAQISVDLPFEGVPVCYTWPSQGSLLGYSVDETNAAWTTTHLKQFLLELVEKTDAKSINVIAHSMGNRPMTAAMEQIGWQLDSDASPLFDRVVLAAPDVDADRFRRDFGPSLCKVANHVTLYASSDDQALIVSKQVHGYPRAGESGDHVVVVPGVETIDVSGIDLSLLGHSYYGDSKSMLHDLYQVVRSRLSASQRPSLKTRRQGDMVYWQLALQNSESAVR